MTQQSASRKNHTDTHGDDIFATVCLSICLFQAHKYLREEVQEFRRSSNTS